MNKGLRLPLWKGSLVRILAACLLAWMAAISVARGEELTLARRLCAEYEKLDSVSCEMQKTISSGRGSIKWLSRIFYQKGDRIHVENVAPEQRRIISDGKVLYYYASGDRRGYSKAVSDLPPEWMISLHAIPGTPMDHLLKLKDTPEIVLEATPVYPLRRAYQAPNVFVVLSCDATGRLSRVEFYSSAERKTLTAEYEYGLFHKVSDTCWIPCLHKATRYLPNGEKVDEIRRVTNLAVNEPIAPAMFEHLPFFQNVEFTGEFEKTYTE